MTFIPVTGNWMEKVNTKLIEKSFSIYNQSLSVFFKFIDIKRGVFRTLSNTEDGLFEKIVNDF